MNRSLLDKPATTTTSCASSFTAHLESPPRAGFFSSGELIAKFGVPVS
jgi:hypothetical protein